MTSNSYRSGFTLLELLIFIVVAGITAVLLASFLLRITRFSTANTIANSVDQSSDQLLSNIEFFLSDAVELIEPRVGVPSTNVLVRTDSNEFIELYQNNTELLLRNLTTEEFFQVNSDETEIQSVEFIATSFQQVTEGMPITVSLETSIELAFVSPNPVTTSFEYTYENIYSQALNISNSLLYLPTTEDLELWLRSDKDLEIDTLTDNIVFWRDQIQDRTFTPAGANAPTAIVSGDTVSVTFDGVNQQLNASGITGLPQGDSQRTIFAVADIDATTLSTENILLEYGTTASPLTYPRYGFASKLGGISELGFQYNPGTFFTSFLATPLNRPLILWSWYDSQTHALYLNNDRISSESITLETSGDTLFLGSSLENSNHFQGRISEVLVYSRALTLSERRGIIRYLTRKYSIPGLGLSEDILK